MIKDNSEVILSVKNLTANIDDKEILKGFNLEVKAGEIHAIMGLNGSGKSTFSKVLSGHPSYQVTGGEITFLGQNLLELAPEERALAGIFLAFQYPIEIPGVSNLDFLRVAYNAHQKHKGLEELDAFDFDELVREKLDIVKMRDEFLERSVNEGFSGGEKKRNEILQMALLEPKLAILDETDSGLDIDALRIVASGVNQLANENNGLLLITHYQRLLDYIIPDFVHVVSDGRIIKTGTKELAFELEEQGYDDVVGCVYGGGLMTNNTITETQEVSYLNHLLEQIQGGFSEPPLPSQMSAQLQEIRDHALTWIKELEIPTKRDEEWRFTDLSPLLAHSFQSAHFVPLENQAIASLILPESEHKRIVFVNGIYAPHLSDITEIPKGIFIGNLAELPEQFRDRIPDYLSQQQGNQDVFATLNSTGLKDAAVVWADKNKIIEDPIHLLFIALPDNIPVINQPRTLIVAETGSSITFIEHYATAEIFGCSDQVKVQPYFTNAVTEIYLEENAQVNHTRLQRGSGSAFDIGKSAIFQARNSRYTCHAISLGSKLSRHNLEVYQRGEATETTLNGLTLIGSEQLADTHSSMMLNHQHGTFNQVHKCIIDDKAHGIFNGKVFVPQTAQFTNANQLSRNLLLSSKGRIDTKPQLEIVADNVKCSHGATVSQLEADEVFYLRSRGLSEQMSRHLLIDAFAAEILGKLPSPTLIQVLSRCVSCRTDFS